LQGLDTAFTQLFKTFLTYHYQELLHIAWDPCDQPQRERQRHADTANAWMSA
jgi:hypothetical protein